MDSYIDATDSNSFNKYSFVWVYFSFNSQASCVKGEDLVHEREDIRPSLYIREKFDELLHPQEVNEMTFEGWNTYPYSLQNFLL